MTDKFNNKQWAQKRYDDFKRHIDLEPAVKYCMMTDPVFVRQVKAVMKKINQADMAMAQMKELMGNDAEGKD